MIVVVLAFRADYRRLPGLHGNTDLFYFPFMITFEHSSQSTANFLLWETSLFYCSFVFAHRSHLNSGSESYYLTRLIFL